MCVSTHVKHVNITIFPACQRQLNVVIIQDFPLRCYNKCKYYGIFHLKVVISTKL